MTTSPDNHVGGFALMARALMGLCAASYVSGNNSILVIVSSLFDRRELLGNRCNAQA
jgi:hypothetical protein